MFPPRERAQTGDDASPLPTLDATLSELRQFVHTRAMRTLDYEVLQPGAFLRETLMACPRNYRLKLEGSLPAALVDVCGPFLAGASWLRWLQPKCYVIPAGDAHGVLDALCTHARALRLHDLSLASPKDTRIWFEAPHFGDSSTLFIHDDFPAPLLRRLVTSGTIKLCDWEVKAQKT